MYCVFLFVQFAHGLVNFVFVCGRFVVFVLAYDDGHMVVLWGNYDCPLGVSDGVLTYVLIRMVPHLGFGTH